MSKPDIHKMTADLLTWGGYTQRSLATEVDSTQSSVMAYAKPEGPMPAYDVGRAIETLWTQRKRTINNRKARQRAEVDNDEPAPENHDHADSVHNDNRLGPDCDRAR